MKAACSSLLLLLLLATLNAAPTLLIPATSFSSQALPTLNSSLDFSGVEDAAALFRSHLQEALDAVQLEQARMQLEIHSDDPVESGLASSLRRQSLATMLGGSVDVPQSKDTGKISRISLVDDDALSQALDTPTSERRATNRRRLAEAAPFNEDSDDGSGIYF
ncbi:MAG: hypothetical protein SGCHY_004591 [Lobulomycetales sp.]